MGQYYMPTIKRDDKVETFYSHEYDNGLKLMEHSWVGNKLVNAVTYSLVKYGGGRLFWIGDYADYEDIERKNPDYAEQVDKEPFEELIKTVWEDRTLSVKIKNEELEQLKNKHLILINRDKEEYIDLNEYVEYIGGDWIVHPLPLLCAVGNGKGGGDFWGNDEEAVGRWAGDYIEIEEELSKSDKKTLEDITYWYAFRE